MPAASAHAPIAQAPSASLRAADNVAQQRLNQGEPERLEKQQQAFFRPHFLSALRDVNGSVGLTLRDAGSNQ